MDASPTVYVLCGLPGSGKTARAKELEAAGIPRRLAVVPELREAGQAIHHRGHALIGIGVATGHFGRIGGKV